MSFSTYQFSPDIMAQIESSGFTTPTPIQSQTIPFILKGRDVIGLAQTGTGKTAAFVLPMLHHLLNGKRGQLRSLIIAPTRELAEQINGAIQTFGKRTGLRSAAIYGGVSMYNQIRALQRGLDIVCLLYTSPSPRD